MARDKKKITLKDIDDEVAEVDNLYMVVSDPDTKNIPIGEYVYVNIPLYSRSTRFYRDDQFKKGLISKEQYNDGCLYLNDRTILEMNKTYSVLLTPEIKDMLKRGILRGGGRTRTVKRAPPMITYSREEAEECEKRNK